VGVGVGDLKRTIADGHGHAHGFVKCARLFMHDTV
jgi:hypothetical protein